MNLRDFMDKRICVAVSGGVDSISLLHYLKAREREFGFILSALHCEHGIRGEESLADMCFVQETCKAWGIPLHLFKEDCPLRAKMEKTSLETAARNFRQACFQALIDENKTDFIATAHHANDEAETILFRLARGASLTGAVGMVEMNGCFIRPFLAWTRVTILAYAKENHFAWREDRTNLETDATRNKLRLEVLPKLQEAVPGTIENMARFAHLAGEDDELLYEYAKTLIMEEGVGFTVAFSKKKPLFRRACLLALKELGVERDYTALHLENLYHLQELERGAKQSLPKSVEAEKTEKGVFLYKKTEQAHFEKGEERLFDKKGFNGGMYEVKVYTTPIFEENFSLKILRLDLEKLPKTAVFRYRKEGDFIERCGSGKKSLKKFFNEEKTPVSIREWLPLIAEKEGGEVYAVCGVEISEKVKITAETKEIAYIKLEEK